MSERNKTSFRSDGLRTDGREMRPHKPWSLNTGAQTADLSKNIPLTQTYKPTAFSSATTPRLGGLMQPQFNFAARVPMGVPSGTTSQQVKNDIPSSLMVPSDTPAPSMFAGVTDAGAPPMGSTQSNGWITTGKAEAEDIVKRYSPNVDKLASNLPY